MSSHIPITIGGATPPPPASNLPPLRHPKIAQIQKEEKQTDTQAVAKLPPSIREKLLHQ